MTRFARAKGSKASNERVAEDATSWADMKQQLQQTKQAAEDEKKQKHADAKRRDNYDKFVKDVEAEQVKNNQWADFPATITTNTTLKKKKQKGVKTVKTEENTVEVANEVANTDQNDNVTKKDIVTPKKMKANKRKLSNGNLDIPESSANAESSENKSAPSPAKKKKNQKKPDDIKPPKKSIEEMTDEEKKKFEKKKEKKMKQLEKRKLKKQQIKDQLKLANVDADNNETLNINGAQNNQANKNQIVNKKNQDTNNKNQKAKTKKLDDNKEHKRRKPQDNLQKVTINGKDVELVYFDGFPIKREDAERLTALRKQMISKGLPRSEVRTAMKLERRRAEKALSRDKKNVCYNCRMAGHVLSECPAINANDATNVDTASSGICFKCGSTEHTSFVCKVVKSQEFRFASCFICKEQGHISWQCPDNARGLYPKGGGCKLCGDVTHLKKDCPQYVAEQEANAMSLDTLAVGSNPDCLDTTETLRPAHTPRVNKIIKF